MMMENESYPKKIKTEHNDVVEKEDCNVWRHHAETLKNAQEKLNSWNKVTADSCMDPQIARCERCWTRKFQCYCSVLQESKDKKSASREDLNVDFVIYLSLKELGRTANTAHILKELIPENCTRLLYTDEVNEQKLIAEIASEIRLGVKRTSILYPSNDASSIQDWQHPPSTESAVLSSETVEKSSKKALPSPRPRLVALDGTYKEAARMYKYLQRCLRTILDDPAAVLPVVKLDLGVGGKRSAYLGLQAQPTKNALCTYQACVLALREMGQSAGMCEWLDGQLHKFIDFILKCDIKHAKPVHKVHKKQKWKPSGLDEDEGEVRTSLGRSPLL